MLVRDRARRLIEAAPRERPLNSAIIAGTVPRIPHLALLFVGLGLLPGTSSAQRGKPAGAGEVHKSNLPPERRAAPLPDEVAPEKRAGTGIVEEVGDRILAWHHALAGALGASLAWAALASPLWLPLAIVIALKLARRRRTRAPTSRERAPERRAGEERADPSRGERVRPGGPRGDRTAPVLIALNLTREQELLCARSGQGPSLYDTFLGLGPDLESLRCFRQLVARELDAAGWAAAVSEARGTKLRSLAPEWTAAVAIARLTGWLGRHPLVAERSLVVQAPASLAEGELEGLTLTQPDGLGTALDAEQKQLLYQARRALARIAPMLAEPLALTAAAGQTRLLSLLPAHMTEERERSGAPFALGLAVRGLPALDWAIAVGLFPAELAADLRDHLREHDKLVGTPVPAEGSAVHALAALRGQGCGEPLGLLLASVAGAAFSSSSVALRMSKRVGSVFAAEAHEALARLGGRVRAALDDEGSAERALLLENTEALLGAPLLAAEHKRAASLTKEVERWSAKEPLWRAAPDGVRPPDHALATLHAQKVKVALDAAAGARDRLLAILERLGQAGAGEREQRLGAERLGLVVAAFGMALLQGGETELLSLGRDAQKALTPEGS